MQKSQKIQTPAFMDFLVWILKNGLLRNISGKTTSAQILYSWHETLSAQQYKIVLDHSYFSKIFLFPNFFADFLVYGTSFCDESFCDERHTNSFKKHFLKGTYDY